MGVERLGPAQAVGGAAATEACVAPVNAPHCSAQDCGRRGERKIPGALDPNAREFVAGVESRAMAAAKVGQTLRV